MALISRAYVLALYGSRARGDFDCLSDIDMLYVGDNPQNLQIDQSDPRLSVSYYNWLEFKAMHDYGSLFLWHLKMQSRPVKYNYDGLVVYSRLMDTLPEYTRMAQDIESFRLSLRDIRRALDCGDTTVEFELGALATTVRHSAILGCYLLGEPKFGRYSAVETFCKITDLPGQISVQFADLYQFRMMVARQADIPQDSDLTAYAEKWLGWATDVVQEVTECCKRNMR
jgi:predicted nucleotidyltransferase